MTSSGLKSLLHQTNPSPSSMSSTDRDAILETFSLLMTNYCPSFEDPKWLYASIAMLVGCTFLAYFFKTFNDNNSFDLLQKIGTGGYTMKHIQATSFIQVKMAFVALAINLTNMLIFYNFNYLQNPGDNAPKPPQTQAQSSDNEADATAVCRWDNTVTTANGSFFYLHIVFAALCFVVFLVTLYQSYLVNRRLKRLITALDIKGRHSCCKGFWLFGRSMSNDDSHAFFESLAGLPPNHVLVCQEDWRLIVAVEQVVELTNVSDVGPTEQAE
eukprot:CAMPEP_0175123122 /NCGR_PEP_ID=MMETSP0087-20121206/2075_1 /TAXON_ID=136419 /ORGANISM="Unknown Unknown, Strain D1" /LENGTH=270 /DNA_ID=CAMNT_0016404793 /DNA_START=320 /DNA_END=1132 /DNA_ORIENTATION=+